MEDATIEIIQDMIRKQTGGKAPESELVKKVIYGKFDKTADSQDIIAALKVLCDVSDFLSTNVCPYVRKM